MHHYAHHIGDFIRDTVHLSPLEECFYRRALDQYYLNESPLPCDMTKLCRRLRASSEAEIAAVTIIIEEFFDLEEDGWHQSRCDLTIEMYQDAEPDVEIKKKNAAERKRRSRERRAKLFESLRAYGIVPPYTTTNVELQAMLDTAMAQEKPASNTEDSQQSNESVTCDIGVTSQENPCDGTANHKPLTSNHKPETKGNNSLSQNAGEEISITPILVDSWIPEFEVIQKKLRELKYGPCDTAKFDLVLTKFKTRNLGLYQPVGVLVLSLCNWIEAEIEKKPQAQSQARQQEKQVQKELERQTESPRTKDRKIDELQDWEIYSGQYTAGHIRNNLNGDETPDQCVLRLTKEKFASKVEAA